MTQHECSRLGCTRLTSEQECDLHAAEPAGVVHQAKEPRPVTREEFIALLDAYVEAISHETYLNGDNCFPSQKEADAAVQEVEDSRGLVQLAFDALATERDEWKRRADKAEAERDAARVSRADLMSWARGVINSATRHGIRVCECEEECEACGLDPHACSETLCAQTCQCSYCFACMLDELDKAVDRAVAYKGDIDAIKNEFASIGRL